MKRNVYHKFRSSLYLILSLLLLICLASCYPTFKNPIPPPPELKADNQILGTWIRTTESDSKQQLLIFQRSSGWIDVVLITHIDSDVSMDGHGINVAVFEGYSTAVNKQQFLCLRLREKDLEGRARKVGDTYFLIANYETSRKDELIIRVFSIQKVKELIKEGKLKGEVFERRYVDEVTVTSSSDELIEVISREGVEAFIGQDEEYDILVFSRFRETRRN